MKRTVLWLVIVAAVGAAGWLAWQRTRSGAATPATLAHREVPAQSAGKVAPLETPVDLAKHDGQTIDFSSGKPVVKDSAEDQAALAAGAKDLAAATKGVTFDPPKKQPDPVKN